MNTHDPLDISPSPEMIADLQRICRDELGKELTLVEAEELGLRMFRTYRLMFEVSRRETADGPPSNPAAVRQKAVRRTPRRV